MKKAAIAALAVLMLTTMGGCSSNAGGSTTCEKYLAMNDSDQTQAVTKMLDSRKLSTDNATVMLTRLSVNAYCQTTGSDSDHIDGIYG